MNSKAKYSIAAVAIGVALLVCAWIILWPRIHYSLSVKRFQAIHDQARILSERQASSEEVLQVLGEPDRVSKREDCARWFYRGPDTIDGRLGPTLVLRFEGHEDRVVSLGVIEYD